MEPRGAERGPTEPGRSPAARHPGGRAEGAPTTSPASLRGGVLLLAALLAAGCGGDGDVERPAPLGEELPVEYPLELWDLGVEGEAVVRARVDAGGRVDTAFVVESSGHASLDSAAVRGISEMRFRPAVRDGEEIAVWARIPVRFTREAGPETGAGGPPPEEDRR